MMHTTTSLPRPPVAGAVLVPEAVTPRRLTLAAAAATVVAAGGALVVPGLVPGEPVMVGSLRGTALVALLVVPVLLGGARWGRTDWRALVGWVAASAYLLYQGVMFTMASPIGALFLADVAMLGLAGWTLGALLVGTDRAALASAAPGGFPARTVGTVLGVAALLNLLAWLVPAAPVTWTGEAPAVVVESGLPTSVTWVQDLAFWIPAALVLAVRARRERRDAGVWAAAFLGFWTLEALGVASDQWWGARADASHPALASTTAAVGALVVALALGTFLAWALRRRPTPGRGAPAGRGPVARRWALGVLAGLTSAAALAGAAQLWLGIATPPVSDLRPLGLHSWLLPGVWLFATVAVPCAVVAESARRGSAALGERAVAAAALLLLELAVQIPFVGTDPLQPTMAAVAVVIGVLGRLVQRDTAVSRTPHRVALR